ncbi:hypothetical protein FZ983_17055 [Azospirillum sp. B21]|uniref:DnaA N-terminal domain-containing protein n=1 Tax=Azospirillum sp. B21 TaxID=2607496 RepID=UPI0011EDC9C2|nr:hypothetical protein [Azospirillum sp. B21]KAA0579032.1 hypothetical protein FZ983_17055 [Azospirillum sp. B21]
MARIRSTHPGQWTDEEFVECQPLARLLALALRNEADDQGVFEWKPTTLKMRLMPADNVDVGALLAELEAHRLVVKFEAAGKVYGAIRNFIQYQRVKKPSKVHPLPAELRKWVRMDLWPKGKGSELDTDQEDDGSEPEATPKAASSEPRTPSKVRSSEQMAVQGDSSSPSVPHQFGTGGEIAPQRKEVGGRREEEGRSRIGESLAGGRPYACAHEAGRPADDFDDGIFAVRQGVVAGFENWFDLPGRPISPADGELFADWIAAGTERGLSPVDTAAAVVEEVQRQFRQLAGKDAGPPRSLRAVLDRDVRAAIANARPGSKPKPLPEVPEPYAKHFDQLTFATWIAPCQIAVADGVAKIIAPNSLFRERVAGQFAGSLKAALGVEDIEVSIAAGQGRNAA